jgi:hypothetical protein
MIRAAQFGADVPDGGTAAPRPTEATRSRPSGRRGAQQTVHVEAQGVRSGHERKQRLDET